MQDAISRTTERGQTVPMPSSLPGTIVISVLKDRRSFVLGSLRSNVSSRTESQGGWFPYSPLLCLACPRCSGSSTDQYKDTSLRDGLSSARSAPHGHPRSPVLADFVPSPPSS